MWYYGHMKQGQLKANGVHLQDHEFHTVQTLLANGYDVELIPPTQTKGQRSPDIFIRGTSWELKSPTGGGRNTMKHTTQDAGHQSRNVIIDLWRCKLPENQAIRELRALFGASKRIKRLLVITEDGQIHDLTTAK